MVRLYHYPKTSQQDITENIKYIAKDGNTLHTAFNKTKQVTGEETVVGAPINYCHFDKVDSPTIAGYYPDKKSIPAQDSNKDLNFTVVYTPTQQVIDYKVVDDTTHQVISGNEPVTLITGKSDEKVPAHAQQKLQRVIQQYLDEGYEQVGTIQVPTNFDHNDKDNQLITIHVKHAQTVVTPDQPKTPADVLPQNGNGEHNSTNHPSQPGQAVVNHGSQPASTAHRQQLPQTGNYDSRAAIGLGLSALLMMTGLLGGQHRKND